ncbi:MAG: pyridoxamine 5'-phosphate oxidase family protein [Campylobacteraceae bacterium]|nr:pyridoxamine 5'-phosphate oxidase family protein [Campylobacteraceae bacterium]
MKSIFGIRDQKIIQEVLDLAEYGTLAICKDNKPYSLPVNFVYLDKCIYFHGSLKGRKIDILKKNQLASFSVVEPYSVIQSYFSSTDNLACPSTHFFKSIMIDGRVEFVQNYEEKVQALSALMQKLQKEGGYKPLGEEVYKKMINATTVCKIIIDSISGKFKFGQHLSQERFDMIIEHLEKRGNKKDINTIKLMKKFKKD